MRRFFIDVMIELVDSVMPYTELSSLLSCCGEISRNVNLASKVWLKTQHFCFYLRQHLMGIHGDTAYKLLKMTLSHAAVLMSVCGWVLVGNEFE